MNKDWHLDEGSFLDALEQEDMLRLVRDATHISFSKGDHVFQLGDPANCVYAIRKGKIKTYLINEDGEEIVLSIRGVGSLFGLSSIFGAGARTGYSTAIEESLCLRITKDVFWSFLQSRNEVSNLVITLLGKRLCQHRAIISDILKRDVKARLARTLLRLYHQFGKPVQKGMLLDIAITQEELANMISARRQTTNRLLKHFENENIVKIGYKRLIITDPAALENMLE